MKLEAKPSSVTRGQDSESILIKQTRIFLNFETQISKLGRPFRLSETKIFDGKWIGKEMKYKTIHTFKYLDEEGGFFEIELGYNNEFIKLEKL